MTLDLLVTLLFVAPLAGAVMAWTYRPVADMLALPFEIVASPLVRLAQGLRRAVWVLDAAVERTLGALVFSERGERSASRLWAVTIPAIFFVLWVVMLVCDISLMAITLRGFFGLPGSGSPVPHLDLQLGVLWGVTVTALLALVFDAWFLGPTRQPWGNLSDRGLKVARYGLLALFALAVFGALVIGLWRQFVLRGASSAVLENLFAMLLMGLLTVTVAITGWYLTSSVGALIVIGLGVLRLLAQGLFVLLHAIVLVLNRLAKLVVAIWRVPAALGRRLVNWLASFSGVREKLHISPIDEFPELPEVGGELDANEPEAVEAGELPEAKQPVADTPAAEPAEPTDGSVVQTRAQGEREPALVGQNGATPSGERLPWE
ncbi:MAG: hypothetical protein DCC58_16920 [Chloroflexi bacterium]|nr:MAG: hypothetical protein DCC58_16920 [Chloroflexota bacterium]